MSCSTSSSTHKCIFCGSPDCRSHACGLTQTNFIKHDSSSGLWSTAANEQVCFHFNGSRGCPKSESNCGRRHLCSHCGQSHSAQTCSLNGFLPVVTHFHWDKWHELLLEAGVLDEFSDIPLGIHYGLVLGHLQLFSAYFFLYSRQSPISCPAPRLHFRLHSPETRAGCYTGPFSPDRLKCLIGPFHTGPLGVVPKPGSTKLRLIQDHSYPRNHPTIPSINSDIDSSKFQCDWGTFNDCESLVANAPPGTQAAMFDVAAAHCCSPIAPEDQRFIRVMFIINSVKLCWIDHTGWSTIIFSFTILL